MVINKKKFIKITLIITSIFMFINMFFLDNIHARYYHIHDYSGCTIYENKSMKELDELLLNTSAYTKYNVGNFVAKCKNKNIAIILYKNLNLPYREIRLNPIDIFDLSVKKSYFGYTKDINESLIYLFDLKIDYENLNKEQKRNLVEVFWPKKIKEEFNTIVEPIILDNLFYIH